MQKEKCVSPASSQAGRAPHIHVHVYSGAGKSILVTQIAFPKSLCDEIYTTTSPYSRKGKQDTTNERDNVFADGFADEMGTFGGNVNEGITLNHNLVVSVL